MSSTRRLGSVRLDASRLRQSSAGARQPGADDELARSVSGLLDRLGLGELRVQVDGLEQAGRGRTLELWLVEVSPEQGAAKLESARGAGPETSSGAGGAPRDAAVRRALALMDGDVKTRWTVASLARAVGLSRAAFARRFAAALGESPIAHLTALRLSRAARSLESGEAGVAEVAEGAGYDSEFAFSRAFKRLYGVPPGAFRRRQRMLQAAALEAGLPEVGFRAGASEAAGSELERLPRRVERPRCLALAA